MAYWDRVRTLLPEGGGLPQEIWMRRHNGIVLLLWVNAIGLVLFGTVQGYGFLHSLAEGSLVAVAAVAARMWRGNRILGSTVATVGLMTASAILVHFAEGSIEAHFHFFVMVTLIILYQDWPPFLLAIGYVVLHHAIFGLIDPHGVFNHPAALANPVKWALIHGGFILGATIAGLTVWKQNEILRASYQNTARRLAEAETRQRDALELNDGILQHLATAQYAFELGLPDKARTELKKSLNATQRIVAELLATSMKEIVPGSLVRKKAAAAGDAQ